jgi:hypothetical protein
MVFSNVRKSRSGARRPNADTNPKGTALAAVAFLATRAKIRLAGIIPASEPGAAMGATAATCVRAGAKCTTPTSFNEWGRLEDRARAIRRDGSMVPS